MTSNAGVGTFVTEAHELASNGLDIFSGPMVDGSLLHGKTMTIYPSSVLTDTGATSKKSKYNINQIFLYVIYYLSTSQ